MKRYLKTKTYVLTAEDKQQLDVISKEALSDCGYVGSKKFLRSFSQFTEGLFSDLKQFIIKSKQEACDLFFIKGLDVDAKKLGPTPSHWCYERREYGELIKFIHFFVASLIGHPYGWKSHQKGTLVSEILPIQGFENYQQGFGSSKELSFHTEDSFHEARASFFTLMCLRNNEKIPTTFYPADLKTLPDRVKVELFKPQFEIVPDDSHTCLTCLDGGENHHSSECFLRINKTYKISILSGSWSDPCVHLDPETIRTSTLGDRARGAYDYLCKKIQTCRTEVVMKPGVLCAVDNSRIAHGRGGFQAKYDGSDRWLQRVLLLNDIKKIACLPELNY